jgi:tRNA uridine 5-carboxymethylaminomethyl modification enzyme
LHITFYPLYLYSGREVGAVTDERWKAFEASTGTLETVRDLLIRRELSPQGWAVHGLDVRHDGVIRRYFRLIELRARNLFSISAFDLLRNPKITLAHLQKAIPELKGLDPRIVERVETEGNSQRPFDRVQS